MYLPVPGIEPTSSEFLDKCVTHKATVADHGHIRYCICGNFYFYSLFIYLGFYVAFNTVQVISRRVVGRAEETSTITVCIVCTVNC